MYSNTVRRISSLVDMLVEAAEYDSQLSGSLMMKAAAARGVKMVTCREVLGQAIGKEILPKIREVLESDDFVALPDKFEIHEYSIMERFCLSLPDEALQNELFHAIRGSGAFRRFKAAIYRKEIQDDWYRFRNEALKRIATDFLESEGIPWLDDVVR